MSASVKQDAAFRWTENGQDYLHYLGAKIRRPTVNPVQQVHRWRSADLTTERVISIGAGVQDLSGTLRFDGSPDSLSRFVAAGRRGASLEYFPSLATPSLSFPCVLVEAGEITTDPDLWFDRRHQVDVRLRRIDGGSWQALLEAPLFYWKAGQALPGLTFTRSGAVGEGVDSDGLLNLYAADVLRTRWLDLDGDFVMDTPSTPIEASRTNVYDFSDDLSDASWTKVRSSVVQISTLASPRGVASAASGVFRLIENTDSDSHYTEQALPALTDDANQSVSFWVRASTRSWVYIQTVDKAGTFDTSFFNLSTGVLGTVAAPHTALFRPGPLASGGRWYRVTVIWDVGNGGSTPRAKLGMSTGDGTITYQGDGSSQVHVWNPQFEVDASSPSTDIVTTSATNVTRADETLFAPFGHRQQRLTAYVRMIERGSAFTPPGVTSGVLHIGGSGVGGDPRFAIASVGGSDGIYQATYDNATAAATASIAGGNAVSLDDEVEVEVLVHLDASEDGDGDVAISQAVGGGAATTPVLASGPSGGLKAGVAWNLDPARIYLGSRGAGDRGYNDLRDVKVMPGVLSLAAMRAL
jgi:hypothetical protein